MCSIIDHVRLAPIITHAINCTAARLCITLPQYPSSNASIFRYEIFWNMKAAGPVHTRLHYSQEGNHIPSTKKAAANSPEERAAITVHHKRTCGWERAKRAIPQFELSFYNSRNTSLMATGSGLTITETRFHGSSGAGLRLWGCTAEFLGSNVFSNNLKSGVFAYVSFVGFTFVNNSGECGGGIYAANTPVCHLLQIQ